MNLRSILTKLVFVSIMVTIFILLSFCSPKFTNPKLIYSTYLGSTGDDGTNNWLKNFSIDESGSIYFATCVYTSDFPVTNHAFDKTYNGGNDWGQEDLAIIEFNTEQNALKYSSYFGGKTGPEFITQVLLKENSLYLVGNTGSSDFPVTNNAYDSTFNGPEFRHSDAYITRFNDKELVYSSYIGTSGTDWAQKIFVNNRNEIILVGLFQEFSELPNIHSFMESEPDRRGYAGIIRLSPTGDSILSSTMLAPSWYIDACMDNEGNIYIAGNTPSENSPVTSDAYDTSFNGGTNDIFVTKLNSTADEILFSTYLGGSEKEEYPLICLDKDKNILIYASTKSNDYPITQDAFDKTFNGESNLFISKLSNDGKKLLYSSFFGGSEKGVAMNASILMSKKGDIFLCGVTSDSTYPITRNALQSNLNGASDIFISVLDPNLKELKFSTFLGGSASESAKINIDNDGNIIGVGETSSQDFKTTPGSYSSTLNGKHDVIIFKIALPL